ncbi:DHHA1 domain-containing protein [Desulfurococcus amylolyticus]|uniref:DHHA1 domain-containing protein n=1 Tax=Desulfurococcus amylolyticus TaxID=94694 RepID=UPI0023F2E824|nr:DHHA1 domain-containing protein [Desulfurococcus amylolyticus]
MPRRVILVHGDSDGVASGALAYNFYKAREEPVVFFTHPVGLLGDLREFTRNGDNIFIADIALNEVHAEEVLRLLEERGRYGEVVYIDHHPEPLNTRLNDMDRVNVYHNTCCSASELTYIFLHERGLDPEYSRIALYGAIGDYLDETQWVKRTLTEWDKRSIYLEAGILIQALEGTRRDYEFKRRIVEYLSRNSIPSSNPVIVERGLEQAKRDEELRVWVKENIRVYRAIGYVVNPPGSIGKAANYARVYGGTRVGIAIEERGDTYVMSLRGDNTIDLNKVLRIMSRELPVMGGGHPFAAGARVKKEFFNEFLVRLDEAIKGFSQQ